MTGFDDDDDDESNIMAFMTVSNISGYQNNWHAGQCMLVNEMHITNDQFVQ